MSEIERERDSRWELRKFTPTFVGEISSWSLSLGHSDCKDGITLTTSEMAELKLSTISLLLANSSSLDFSSAKLSGLAGLTGFGTDPPDGGTFSLITLVPWFSNIRMSRDSKGLTRLLLLVGIKF